MNIEGVNLSSLLPVNNTIEIAEVGAIPEDFSNTLVGQIEVLSEATVQVESPRPLPNITMPQTVNNVTDIDGLLKHKGNEQQLAAFFGKYLPVSNENDLNENIDLEATLLALTDALKAVAPDGRTTDSISMSDEVAAQNMGLILTDSLKAVTADGSTPDPVATADEVTAAQNKSLNPVWLTNSPKAVTSDDGTPDPVATADEVTVAQNKSLNPVWLTNSPKAVTSDDGTPDPVATADEVTAAQNKSLNPVLLTDSPKAVTSYENTPDPVSTPDEVATTQNRSLNLALTDSLKAVTSDDNTPVSVATSDKVATAQNKSLNRVLTDSLKAVTPDSDAISPAFTADEMTTTDNMSLALTDLLKTITPGIIPEEVAVAHNRTGVTALKGLYLTTPLPEEAKLNEVHVVPGDFLQKETVVRQSIQDKQGFNLPYVENTAFSEKTMVFEKYAPISGIEQTPGVTSDITPFHRQIDNRTDSPAITRPLTHPGWSKELGEQIVWMNNKAVPAAEIRLNPVHLGPISVRIDVNQDQATILFTAQHTEIREAIEASIPKLREMLGTQQLNLVNVNISQNSSSDQGRSQSQTFAKTPENHEQGIEIVAENEHDRVAVSKGLLSIYA